MIDASRIAMIATEMTIGVGMTTAKGETTESETTVVTVDVAAGTRTTESKSGIAW